MKLRIGHGYDVHRLAEGRKLILGGVEIPHDKGLLGHSDADVLVHALMDAMLGALALGDIGHLFPDDDPTYSGADSMKLLEFVNDLIRDKGFRIGNLDATILAPFIPAMQERIADVCRIDREDVSVKATTEEKLGFTGEKLGIAAHCVVLLTEL